MQRKLRSAASLAAMIVAGMAAWFALALGSAPLRAQAPGEAPAKTPAVDEDAAAEGESADTGQDKGVEDSIGYTILSKSGWVGNSFYVVLLVFSLIACTVAIERLVNLTAGKVLPPQLVARVRELAGRREDDPRPFREACDASPSPMAAVLRAGLVRAGRPLAEVEKSMEDAAAREIAALRSRNRPINVMASVAPLVGLLGTVVGMIMAFRVSSQAGLGKAELLAEGIYIALITTAMGLSIAIPALLVFAWLNGRVERFFREIDEQLLETLPSFARMERRQRASQLDAEGDEALAPART